MNILIGTAFRLSGMTNMKIYHMIVQPKSEVRFGYEGIKEYLSRTQGAAPNGYVCICVCGYHEINVLKGGK